MMVLAVPPNHSSFDIPRKAFWQRIILYHMQDHSWKSTVSGNMPAITFLPLAECDFNFDKIAIRIFR